VDAAFAVSPERSWRVFQIEHEFVEATELRMTHLNHLFSSVPGEDRDSFVGSFLLTSSHEECTRMDLQC